MAHRPTVLEDPQVGHDRYQLYKASIDQYQKALKDGYFLECITLMESLIKDRLESMYNEIYGADKASGLKFQKNAEILTTLDADALKSDLDVWRKNRNEAIHAMAKLQEHSGVTFEVRYISMRAIAEKGYELFKAIDSAIRKYRKELIKKN